MRSQLGRPENVRIRRKRNASEPDGLTNRGLHHLGRNDIGWWDPAGVNGEVRSIRGYAGSQDSPSGIRVSEFEGAGYLAMHPPYKVNDNVPLVQLGAGKLSSHVIDADYIRVASSVEGTCGFSVPASKATAGDYWTQSVSLQPCLLYVPADVTLTVLASTNVASYTVTNIDTNGFDLNITVTANGVDTYFRANFATLSSTTPPPPPPPGTGPIFGIDRIANQTHPPSEYPDFFICRRSMGLSHDSDSYASDVFSEATGAGKLILFYHYGLHGGTAEADVFTAAVGRTVGAGNEKNYGMAFDWEEHSTSTAQVQSFMNRVRSNTGGKCGLYTFWYFRPGGYPYGIGQNWNWVSYVVHPNHRPPGPYDIWQYNVKYVHGFGIDQDRSEMSKADLLARIT